MDIPMPKFAGAPYRGILYWKYSIEIGFLIFTWYKQEIYYAG